MKPLTPADPSHIGSYRLLGVLGGGGMGRVYLGQSRTGRRLAIKVVRFELADDPVFRERFAREVAAVRRVNPLYTAPVVDADTDAREPWLATTFIDGPSLEQWVSDAGPLSSGAVLTLAAGLAEALASIHRAGLVHRDLKPSNVLLDDTGPHIIDFGVALAPDAIRMTTSLVVGTPSYMAPERIHGDEAGPAADVFSLGATLVFAATGRGLVTDDTVYAQVMQIVAGQFDLAAVPPELRPLIVRCISHRPQDRPTAAELAQILVAAGIQPPGPGWHRSATAVPPNLAVPPPLRTRLSRRRVLAVGGVVGVLAVGGGAAARLFGWPARPRRPGDVLWLAQSGAAFNGGPVGGRGPGATDGPNGPNGPGPNGPGGRGGPGAAGEMPADPPPGERIIVAGGRRIIVADASGVVARDALDGRRQSAPVPSTPVALWPWGDAVLVTDPRELRLLDAASLEQRVEVDLTAGEVEAATDRTAVHVGSATVAADRAFFDLGTAIVAIDRGGRRLWRAKRSVPRDERRMSSNGPQVANETWLVVQETTAAQMRVTLYGAATGTQKWSVTFGIAPQLPGDGGPGRGGNEAWQRSEGRIGTDHIVLRYYQEVRVLRLADGVIAWHLAAEKPVTAIELLGDVVVVAGSELTAYAIATGEPLWQRDVRGARIGMFDNGRSLVAVDETGSYGLDPQGTVRWRAKLPDELRRAAPDRLMIDGQVAYVTFRPTPEQQGPLAADVIAVALDAEA